MAFLPFPKPDLAVDSPLLGLKGTYENENDTQMGDHKTGLVFFPGKSGKSRTKEVDGEKDQEAPEPPSPINESFSHRCGIAGFHDGTRRQKDREDEDHGQSQLDRAQEPQDLVFFEWIQRLLPR